MGSHQHYRRQVPRGLVHECPRYSPRDSRVGHAAGTPVLSVRIAGATVRESHSRFAMAGSLAPVCDFASHRHEKPGCEPGNARPEQNMPELASSQAPYRGNHNDGAAPQPRTASQASEQCHHGPFRAGAVWHPRHSATRAANVTHLATRALACLSGEWLLRRSFQACRWPAAVLLRPQADGRSVAVSDRCIASVLARMWHVTGRSVQAFRDAGIVDELRVINPVELAKRRTPRPKNPAPSGP